MMLELCVGYLLLINLLGYYMMWSDKQKAKKDLWRIPERNFFIVSILGGSIGLWAGMQTFRHKTQHVKFTVGLPAILIVQIALVLLFAAKVV